MVGVAQLVRAPDCGSGGRGFETRHPPHGTYLANKSRRIALHLPRIVAITESELRLKEGAVSTIFLHPKRVELLISSLLECEHSFSFHIDCCPSFEIGPSSALPNTP